MRGSTDVSPSSLSLFAFKPRQVLLLEQRQRNLAPMASELKPEDESILTFSIALWLENKGFSKVLKRFLSAAQIEDENWKARALNLNEIFSKYQEICKGCHEDLKFQNKQEEQVAGTTESNGNANRNESEEKSKKKKKKSKGDVVVTDTGKTPEDTAVSEKSKASYVNGSEDQNQKTSDGISNNFRKSKTSKKSNDDEVSELTVDPSTKKQKDKKKKKSKSMSQSLDGDEKQIDVVTESKQKNILSRSSEVELPEKETAIDKKSKKRSLEAAEDGIDESKKASKKRKRMAPGENENQSGQEVAVEESKPKKTKGLGDNKNVLPQNVSARANGHADKQSKQENFQTGEVGTQQTDESTKVALNNNEVEKSREPKSARKQRNGSAEPKTVKAFQRVNVEDVEFADERLQDNSYWAKDGAEIGYGAKAQDVLGQVRGRDFRHEKTKKKRGSYRGGQIDLQSHSIKFNYSDDE